MYFPAPEIQTTETRGAGALPLPLGRGELILVADDEQSVLKLADGISSKPTVIASLPRPTGARL